MGDFNLDDLLSDLGTPDPNAPEEPGNDQPAPNDDADPNTQAEQTPGQGKSVFGATNNANASLFVRNNPEDTPRPPDLTGHGLGSELNTHLAADTADPIRLKPGDSLSELYHPEETALATTHGGDLGQALLTGGLINAEQLASVHRVLKQSPGMSLAQATVEMGVPEASVMEAVARQTGLRFERVDPDNADGYNLKMMNRLGFEYCKANLVLPLREEGSRFVVGTSSPDDVFLIDEMKRRLGLTSVKHVLIPPSDITGLIESLTDPEDEVDVDEILADVTEDDVEIAEQNDDDEDGIEEEAESSPVVRYVNHIIQTALKEGASDIHIEPDEKTLKVRFRIDGVLFEMMNPPKKMHAALSSRIKIMANLDIAERRLPQDGRIRATVSGRKLDLRVSTVPTPKGEKTVMRILDNRSINVGLDQLGFGEDTLSIWKNQIAQPHGIILVTGPTGSGKTTTLYSSLRQMDLRKLNVSTVEDPVEYNLSGITQIQTHERIGMTFAAALRALLRQDPDVVMLGEIRDIETATIAIQASLTGHLVLSTLHTNDAPSSITRMINIGIEPFLIGAAVNAVLAQRLVRKICTNCVEETPVKPDTAEFLTMHGINTETVKHGKGCSSCRETGHAGRLGLYELLMLDDTLRDAIAGNPNVTEFRRICCERGMVTLRQDGFEKVAAGQTTVEEILRVTEATI